MNNLQNQITKKIKRLRNQKGLSQPEMADLLHIDKSVYARLEMGKTYAWAKYLEELLKIFEITPDKFFEDIGNNITINNSNCPFGGNANIENIHTENRDVYEKFIASKDEQIALLKDLLEKK